MAINFQKKTASLLVTFFIGILVLAFAVSGLQTGTTDRNVAGKVGSYEIKLKEYQNQYDSLVSNYARMTGSQNLTQKQIKTFGIQTIAFSNVVSSKLRLILADELSVVPSKSEIKTEIKKLPYFQNKETKEFNYDLYSNLLRANGYSIKDFEEQIGDDLKGRQAEKLFDLYYLSDGYLKDLSLAKRVKFKTNAVQFLKDDMRIKMPVSKNEIDAYIADEKNKEKIANLFKSKKSKLDQEEEIKARHILVKISGGNEAEAKKKIDKIAKQVNVTNFKKMANKYTEDPSGKGKGGDLGWFKKGRMVKEFEQAAFALSVGGLTKPVKTLFGYHIIYVEKKKQKKEALLKDHASNTAKELLQKGRSDEELEKFANAEIEKLVDLISRGKRSAVESYAKEIKGDYTHQAEIDRLNPNMQKIKLNPSNAKDLFSSKDLQKSVKIYESAGRVTIVQVTEKVKPRNTLEEEIKAQRTSQGYQFRSKIRTGFIDFIKEDAKVESYLQFDTNES